MNRLIGLPCPGCSKPLTAQSELLEDAALCIECGCTLEIDAEGVLRVISEAELARFDADIRRTLARAIDEIERQDEPHRPD